MWLTALAVLGFIVTIDRVPIVTIDEIIYASIARAMQLRGTGVPTVLDGVPAIDHVGFYGPVYFGLAALLFDVFGFSIAAFRSVGVVGALLAAGSGALLARWLGQGRERQWWTAVLLLLTPEIGYTATGGRMDTLALGFCLLALGFYVRGLETGRGAAVHGAAAGVCLVCAALTAPRTYPFVAVFMASALALPIIMRDGRHRLRQSLYLLATLGLGLGIWATLSHGGPVQWARFLWYIASHDEIEVAIVPGSVRRWAVARWHVVTSVAAVVGAVAAIVWRDRSRPPGTATGTHFALAVGVLNFALTLWMLNLTFSLAIYFAVGLLAVVLAAFPRTTGWKRTATLTAMTVLLTGDLAVRVVRTGRVAATWAPRDPDLMDAFVRDHVPAGSLVYGPAFFYFYAVERAGSRYLYASGVSGADWTRNVPQAVATTVLDPEQPRYMIWPVDEDLVEPLPQAFVCPGSRVVARFEPPPDYRHLLGPLGELANSMPETYQSTVLRRLPPGCGNQNP
jgi:hypothetical protein